MFLSLTALSEGQTKDFNCQFEQIKTAFDVLACIVAKGDILLSAQIMEHEHWLDLPVNEFNDHSFTATIEALQQEWESILINSRPLTANNPQPRVQLRQRQLDQWESHIASLEHILQNLTQLHQRAERCGSHQSEPSQVTTHLAGLIRQYARHLSNARQAYRQAFRQLSQLVLV